LKEQLLKLLAFFEIVMQTHGRQSKGIKVLPENSIDCVPFSELRFE